MLEGLNDKVGKLKINGVTGDFSVEGVNENEDLRRFCICREGPK